MGEPGKFSTTLLFGLGAALSMMLVTFGTYRAGPETFLGPAAYLGNAVIILLAAAAAFIRKRANGGVLGFRPALKAAFSVLVLGVFGQYLFTWFLLNTIDPHFRDSLIPVIARNSEAAYRKFGMPEDQIKRALDGEKGVNPFALGRMVTGLGFLFVINFLIALLIAATVRTKTSSPARPRRSQTEQPNGPQPTEQPNGPQPL
jgi:hypothetical protein